MSYCLCLSSSTLASEYIPSASVCRGPYHVIPQTPFKEYTVLDNCRSPSLLFSTSSARPSGEPSFPSKLGSVLILMEAHASLIVSLVGYFRPIDVAEALTLYLQIHNSRIEFLSHPSDWPNDSRSYSYMEASLRSPSFVFDRLGLFIIFVCVASNPSALNYHSLSIKKE